MKLRIDRMRAFGSCSVADFPIDKEHPHGFSKWEVNIHVGFTEEGQVTTCFRVYPKAFSNWKDCLYECHSYNELKSWLEEHKDEIQ